MIEADTSLLFLLRNTHSTSSPTCCLGMLTSDPDTPVMTQAAVSSNLLEALQIFSEFVLELVGQNLRILAVAMVFLSVQEPVGDFILSWVLHDCDNPLNLHQTHLYYNMGSAVTPCVCESRCASFRAPYLLIIQFSCSLSHVYICLLTNQIGIAPPHTLQTIGLLIHTVTKLAL